MVCRINKIDQFLHFFYQSPDKMSTFLNKWPSRVHYKPMMHSVTEDRTYSCRLITIHTKTIYTYLSPLPTPLSSLDDRGQGPEISPSITTSFLYNPFNCPFLPAFPISSPFSKYSQTFLKLMACYILYSV